MIRDPREDLLEKIFDELDYLYYNYHDDVYKQIYDSDMFIKLASYADHDITDVQLFDVVVRLQALVSHLKAL